MTARDVLSAAAKAELDRTLEALGPRVLEETAVIVGTTFVVTYRTLKAISRSLSKGSRP